MEINFSGSLSNEIVLYIFQISNIMNKITLIAILLFVAQAMPATVFAQDCGFITTKYQHKGQYVKVSKLKKDLKPGSTSNFAIKAAKIGNQKGIALSVSIIAKFNLFHEDPLVLTMDDGKTVGLKPIADFASRKGRSGSLERATGYYVISVENFKILSRRKIKKVKVNLGSRIEEFNVKAENQGNLIKVLSCFK